MALCGGLLRAGWSVERADELLSLVMQVRGDTDKNHLKARATKEKIDAGLPVTGWKEYAELTETR